MMFNFDRIRGIFNRDSSPSKHQNRVTLSFMVPSRQDTASEDLLACHFFLDRNAQEKIEKTPPPDGLQGDDHVRYLLAQGAVYQDYMEDGVLQPAIRRLHANGVREEVFYTPGNENSWKFFDPNGQPIPLVSVSVEGGPQ